MNFERTFFVYGRIGSDDSESEMPTITSKDIIEQLKEYSESNSEVTIILHSLGGTYDDIMDILHFQFLLPYKLNVYSFGCAMGESSALLFGATGKRIVSKTVRITTTDVFDDVGYLSLPKIKEYGDIFFHRRNAMLDLISRRSGIDSAALTNEIICSNGKPILAEHALKLGIVDEVFDVRC